MNKTELVAAIENGATEFFSQSEGIQYTVTNDCDGWKADGVEAQSGLDGGFYTAKTLGELTGYLEQIGDLEIAQPVLIIEKKHGMTKLNTLSYVYGQNDTIETGEEYYFGQLWDGDGDGEELLESGAIAVYQDGEEYIVDFEIVETDEDDILQSVVKVSGIN